MSAADSMPALRHRSLALVAGLLGRGQAEPWTLRQARRFLFLQYETALGTAVHATPVFEALRRAVPGCRIVVACHGLPAEVLRHNPHIDQVWETPHPGRQWLRSVVFFLTRVRARRRAFDCVVVDSGNRRSRFGVLARLTGVRARVGFRAACDLHHASVPYDPEASVLANNLRLLGLLGHRAEAIEPAVYFDAPAMAWSRSFLEAAGAGADAPVVALQTQTSGGHPNHWYDDRFAALADRLAGDLGARIVFVGSRAEAEAIESLRRRLRQPALTAAGLTDIPRLAALLCRCDLLVTLDTGTMHVGRAVGVPMVVIGHAANPPHEWLPLGQPHIRIVRRDEIGCRHCRKVQCATHECMREISVDEVAAAAEQHLATFPPSAAARARRVESRWCPGRPGPGPDS